MKRLLVAIALLASCATAVAQEEHPKDAPGFSANRVYDFHDVDSVNVFNGDLIVRIPIGQEYRVSGLLSYRLMLTYNSHLWDYVADWIVSPPPCSGNDPWDCLPDSWTAAAKPFFNAGLGWTLSLGALEPPASLLQNAHGWIFRTSDGSGHTLWGSSDPTTPNNYYTRDNTHIRMIKFGDHVALVSLPSGVSYLFWEMQRVGNGNPWTVATSTTGLWRLHAILDPIGSNGYLTSGTYNAANAVDIEYRTLPGYPEVWDISHGVTQHHVYLRTVSNASPPQVDHVDLMTAGGGSQRYSFHITPTDIAAPDGNTLGPATMSHMPFLTSVAADGFAGYSMTKYNTTSPLAAGVLQQLVLPTEGSISWNYDEDDGPNKRGKITPLSPAIESPVFISSRTVADRNGKEIGTWNYRRVYSTPVSCPIPINQCPGGKPCTSGRSRQLTVFVTEPSQEPGVTANVRTTISYFTVYERHPGPLGDACSATPQGWDSHEGGLPFTRYETDGGSRYLSSEVRTNFTFPPTESIGRTPANGTVVETKYVAYQSGDATLPLFGTITENDWQPVSETTYYGLGPAPPSGSSRDANNYFNMSTCALPSCRLVTTDSRNPDSMGHFRQTSSYSTFPLTNGRYRTTFTNYDQQPAAPTWVSGTYTDRCSADEATPRLTVVSSCSDLAPASSDPLSFEHARSQFDLSLGHLLKQTTYNHKNPADSTGGETVATFAYKNDTGERTSEVYSGADAGTTYTITHNWTYSSGALASHTAQYQGTNFYVADESYDPYTGAVSKTRDTTGLETTYGYDTLGRLRTITPPDRKVPGAAGSDLAPTSFTYNDATATAPAKVVAEQKTGSTLLTQHEYDYDDIGRLVQELVLLPSGTSTKRTVLNALDKPLQTCELQPPPAQSCTRYANYDGFSRAGFLTAPDGHTTTVTYDNVWQTTRTFDSPAGATTVENSDERGRLLSITENAGPGGAPVTTRYDYDVADRLSLVTTDNASQQRKFTYDPRGFLASEKYPELDGGEVDYSNYDARGHAGQRSVSTDASKLQLFTYDSAERLISVKASAGLLKQFEFATANSTTAGNLTNYTNGKLFRSTRHNYTTDSQVADYVVSQLFEYTAPGGAVSKKTTCVEDRLTLATDPCTPGAAIGGARQRVFASTFNYDQLGNTNDVGYPSCSACTAAPAQRHALSAYTNGLLTSVNTKIANGTPAVTGSITYATNGTIATITHPGGAVDTISLDDNYMPRPKAITFSGWSACAPPTIVSEPADVTVSGNPHVTLSVAATGDGPFTYTWFKDGAQAQSGSLSTYSPGPVTTTTKVWVVVSNACGPTTSRVATVSPSCVPPAITLQPATIEIASGGTATLSVVASGTSLKYTWYFGVVGDTSQPQANDPASPTYNVTVPGSYWVSIRNNCGTTQSSQPTVVKIITVCNPVTIIRQPVSVDQSDPAYPTILGILLGGTAPSNITWHAKLDEPNATPGPCLQAAVGSQPPQPCNTPSIKVAPLETTDYQADITGCDLQHVVSDVVRVRVTSCSEIIVSASPADQRVVLGSSTVLPLQATLAKGNSVTLIATWYQGATGDVSHPLATVSGNANLSYTTLPLISDTQFWCRLSAYRNKGAPPTDLACAIDTPTVTVTICHPPQLPLTLQDAVVAAGTYLKLSVFGTTGDGLSYQWYSGESGDVTNPVPDGARPTIFVLPQPQPTKYWVRVVGECGTVDSRAATVKICYPPQIATQPTDMVIVYGQQPKVTIPISNPDLNYNSISYVWMDDSGVQPVAISTSPEFTVPLLPGGTYTYHAVISNGGCSTESRHFAVFVCVPPALLPPPRSVTTSSGAPVTFSFGSDQPDVVGHWYQGQSGDTSHPLGDGSMLYVAPIVTTSYWVRVDNGFCSTDSATVTADVCTPFITGQPLDTAIVRGDPVTLFVDARGTQPFTFQWYRGQSGDRSNPIPNSNSDTLQDFPVVDTSYWVEITSPCSARLVPAMSRTALVTVCQPPAITRQPQPGVVVVAGTLGDVSVIATGTNLSYQWFIGAPGDTSHPVPGVNGSRITPQVWQTTSFWVRVSACGQSVDSVAAVLCVPPVVNGPADQAVVAGQSVTLDVAADQSATFTWYAGVAPDTSSPVSSGPHYTTPALTQTASYWVRAGNGYCTADSRTATVSVCIPPTVVSSVLNATTTSGQSVLIPVIASGDGELTYAWYAGNPSDTTNPISGPDVASSIYVAPLVSTNYWVRVSNGTCSTDSAVASISVCRPAIRLQPQSTTASSASPAQLSVTAVGTPPLSYQWYAGQPGDTTSPVAGATDATVSGLLPAQTTTYWVRVSTSCGSTDSAAATVTVAPSCIPPSITGSSQSGGPTNALLSIFANGSALQYEWYASDPAGSAWTLIPGANQPNVYVTPLGTTAYYYARVFNSCGAQISTTFTVLGPSCTAPIITTEPIGGSYTAGTPSTLTVAASGTNLSFQWYQSDPDGSTYVPIAGQTSNTLTILPSSAVATYYVVVTNDCGYVQSQSATLVRQTCVAPTITAQSPATVTGAPGTTVELFVTAAGDAPLSVQWYESDTLGGSWTAVPGGTSNPFFPTISGSAYYYAHVSNACGSADSAYIAVVPTTSCAPPQVSVQPASQSLQQQVQVTLSVTASGGGLTYQWFQSTSGTGGWTAIAGATAATLRFTPQFSPAYYFVQISGTCGSVNSSVATIRTLWLECPPPTIYTVPGPGTFDPATGFTIALDASGSGLRYDWYVSDPFGSNLVIRQSGPSNTFSYTSTSGEVAVYVRVFNDCGSYAETGDWIYRNSTVCTTLATVSINPANGATISAGGPGADLSVTATAQGCTITYQWYSADPGFGWVPISGATTPTIHVNPPQTEYYECQVTTSQGTVAVSTFVNVQ